MKRKHLFFLVAFLVGGCATSQDRDCRLPPLSDQEVAEVADAYLQSKHADPKFRATAERRIQPEGCKYAYEESEKLDSLGAGIVIIIDRKKRVITTFGSN